MYHREQLETALMYMQIIEEQPWDKSCPSARRKAVEFDPDEYQKFKYHRNVQKSYVPTPPRAPITIIWDQSLTFLIKFRTLFPSYNLW